MLYKNYDWLYSRYVVDKLSLRKIALECGACHHTILCWLRKFDIQRRTISEGNKGKVRTIEVKEALSKRMVEYHRTHIHHRLGNNLTEETKQKISNTCKEKGIKPPNPKGRVCTEVTRRKRSASFQGISLDEWKSYVSFESYPSEFNFVLKEKIRNRDGRQCQKCNGSELLEGRRLSVHHIDGDKMNCDENNLITLCNSCNNTSDTIEKEFLLKVGG